MEFNALTSNTIDYDYDAIGNRIAEMFNGTTSTYAYSLTSSWLNSIDSEMLTYDQAGNMETDRSGAREFTWTPGGRLSQVEDGGSSVGQYTYDANGQRSQKTTSSGTTYFIYGAGHQLLGEYDASGNTIREYVYLNGEPLAQVNADESMLYLHSDHLGTPRVATDESANPVWSWESDAFGRGAPSGSETVNLRFPGQYYDAETALHYNWNRYYNPETGRYVSSDPIGLDGGLNTYAYVEGNPLTYTDPEGLDINIFVGGAGDMSVSAQVHTYADWFKIRFPETYYFSWDDKQSIRALINSNCDDDINIVGHSYGGDTAADLVAGGLKVNFIITVDPVSWNRPNYSSVASNSNNWINIRARPQKENKDDRIARSGGRWRDKPKNFADKYYEAPFNHGYFNLMMKYAPSGGESAESALIKENREID